MADAFGQAMVDVIMNERAPGVGNRTFDCVKLLREIDALPSAFNHSDYRCQMTVRSFETLNDCGVGLVFHGPATYPLGGDNGNLNRP